MAAPTGSAPLLPAPSGVPSAPAVALEPPSLAPSPFESAPATAEPAVSQPMRPANPETATQTAKKVEEEGIYFNIADDDIREVVKQISRALGKNFLLDDKLRGKVTIISERKMTKDEVWEAFQSALDVLGYTIVDGPAGLLKIVAVRDAISNPIDLYTDKTPFTDRFITRLITLKNISAADMANVIKGLVSKEGNLFAYPVTNTLILTDSGTNIERLMKLINELDQEGPQEVLEIIPIVYATAKDLSTKITQIFETEKGSAPSASPAARPRAGAAPEASIAGDETPRLRKVIADERTNSLIILASKMAIRKVREIIKKLDSPLVGDEGEVHVYYLKYAGAKDMATVLNAIAGTVAKDTKDKKPTGTAAAGGSAASAAPAPATGLVGGAEFSGKFTVTADEGTNSIVITANAKDYNTLIDQVISKLDIPRRQVYVEAVIVELSVTENQTLGVGILGGKNFNVGGNNLALFGSTFGFLNPSQLLSGTVGAANTNQTIDLNLPSTTGTSSTTSVPAFFSAIQFVQNNTNANILSTPNILTLDNQEAEIKIGKKVPFPSASATTIGGSLQTTFTREDVALSLKVKPQISEGGSIRMEVTQEDRDILPDQSAFAATAGPTTTERTIKTAIVAANGQTLVLGGLIRDRYTTRVNKVPGLGDIPILGYLFKQRVKEKEKVNLLVFLTPHIIREPRDFLAILNRKIEEQNNFIESNFNKGQQKIIRRQLETHADQILKAGQWTPEASAPTEEDRYPMELVPPPPAPGEETVPTGMKPSEKKASKEAKSESSPTVESAPAAAQAVVPVDDEEYSDLAIEPKYQKKGAKKASKPKATAPEQAPAEPSKPAPAGGDIDLAY